jgi:sec-independent protein translocase protein TatA
MFGLGMQELIIIMIIVVVLFGATRLPQLGSGIGKAIRNFKEGINEINEETKIEDKEKS